MKTLLKEFKEFAVKGNVVDMAVGVIVGGAFGKIVTSLVNDVIMPLVGVLTGWFRDLDFIAEDLGYPSPEVVQLLSDSGLPGMKVLEFAFDSRDPSDYLPHSCNFNSICYTGTHDNAPLALWRTEADKAEFAPYVREYCRLFGRDADAMLRDPYTVVTPDSKNPYKQMYVSD